MNATRRSDLEILAENLEALASPIRLELLRALRTPLELHEIHLEPGVTRDGEREGRPLSRQGVSHHLDQLLEAGLVQKLAARSGPRGQAYVLNHERLFAVVDEMRGLSKLRTAARPPAPLGQTLVGGQRPEAPLPPRPRLMVAYGRDDGAAFPLEAGATRWRIGRAATCDIRLDYDPYLSSESCILERNESVYVVRDLGSRNGTWVNGEQLPSGEMRALAPGDLLGVGRSTLVFQP